jgi:hypothetical protein
VETSRRESTWELERGFERLGGLGESDMLYFEDGAERSGAGGGRNPLESTAGL